MKRLCTLVFTLFLAFLIVRPARYSIQPQSRPITQNLAEASVIETVSSTASSLFDQYGYRPSYNGQKFAPGEHLTPDQAQATAPYLLVCESGNRDGKSCGIDSNEKPSCGRAQFQDWATFWEPTSGIYGNPLNGNDAITMMLWALENGYIQRWSCARLEHLI